MIVDDCQTENIENDLKKKRKILRNKKAVDDATRISLVVKINVFISH